MEGEKAAIAKDITPVRRI